MANGRIYIGTSGWSYKHWRGIFYPQGLKIANELPYYAGQFNTAEINNTEGLTRFFDVFDPFRRRLGPILIQLPAMLGFHREKVETFFRALKTFKGHRFALEPRHSSWMGADAAGLLRKYRIGFVLALSGGRWPSREFITAPHIYIRLHGPNGYYDTSYSSQKLAALAKKCRQWQAAGHDIWIFFNNDGHAYAVKNATTLKRMLLNDQ